MYLDIEILIFERGPRIKTVMIFIVLEYFTLANSDITCVRVYIYTGCLARPSITFLRSRPLPVFRRGAPRGKKKLGCPSAYTALPPAVCSVVFRSRVSQKTLADEPDTDLIPPIGVYGGDDFFDFANDSVAYTLARLERSWPVDTHTVYATYGQIRVL